MKKPSNERVAAYLGTFDPLTLGHFDIISRASKLFDHLVVGIGQQSSKNPCFSVGERLAMTRGVCASLGNVTVDAFTGLAVEFAASHGAMVLVRGLRTEADYVYEMQMAMMNRILANTLETIFIPTRQELSHLSSSLVKEVAALGGNISQLVPPIVFTHLQTRYKKL